jgi:hypothetical protein
MGEEVFDYFCCCFIHADRLTSLVNFSYFSKENYGGDSIAGRRDRLTSVWLMVGTLKELGLNLHKLRNALVVANLWDRTAWKKTLHKWEDWTSGKGVSALRNQVAFHVDRDRLSVGFPKIPNEDAFIYRSDTLKNREGWFEVSSLALLVGIQTRIGADRLEIDLESVLGSFGEFLAIGHALGDEFIRVLKVLGLGPIIMISKGVKPAVPAVTEVKPPSRPGKRRPGGKRAKKSGGKSAKKTGVSAKPARKASKQLTTKNAAKKGARAK